MRSWRKALFYLFLIINTAQIKVDASLNRFHPIISCGTIDYDPKCLEEIFGSIVQIHYHFLADEYDILCISQMGQKYMAVIFRLFSILAVFFACLGMFALAEFVTLARSKEIGIRKVLGATAASLSFQLSKRFLKLILISTGIAVPLIHIFQVKWLSDFAYRIDTSFWLIIIAIGTAVLISLMTVGLQAYQSANINPIKKSSLICFGIMNRTKAE